MSKHDASYIEKFQEEEVKMKVLVAGAGGFIGGHLVNRLLYAGHEVRAIDKKPLTKWYQLHNNAENACVDLSDKMNCHYVCSGINQVYQLAADMGGMGFIEKFRIECMRSVLINVHMLEAAYAQGVDKYFFSSSACVYNTDLQVNPHSIAGLKEIDAYPAKAERGYGWEKLYSEMLCQEYWAERGLKTYIARFHNVYGPWGTWDGGREKAPAALCRKIIEAKDLDIDIEVWGDGTQRRSYMFIDDCINGIMILMGKPYMVATPVNIGSSESVSVLEMLDIITKIAAYAPEYKFDLSAPKGVGGRNSDNTFIKEKLNWEPTTKLADGLKITYDWIEQQYMKRKRGDKIVT
jgi:nucleoside-diphosphate-sugar epimerase